MVKNQKPPMDTERGWRTSHTSLLYYAHALTSHKHRRPAIPRKHFLLPGKPPAYAASSPLGEEMSMEGKIHGCQWQQH